MLSVHPAALTALYQACSPVRRLDRSAFQQDTLLASYDRQPMPFMPSRLQQDTLLASYDRQHMPFMPSRLQQDADLCCRSASSLQ